MIKYITNGLQFVIFASLFILISCNQSFHPTLIEGRRLAIDHQLEHDSGLEALIAPHRERVNKDLDSVLATAPITLDRTKGRFQSNIGNMMADVCLEAANSILKKRGETLADLCFLNSGGIRNIIPAGPVTARSAYEVMPFENQLVVVDLKGAQLTELVTYFEKDKKNHPFAGMQLFFDEKGVLLNAFIHGQPIDVNKMYRVVTSDYLANGGDYMTFFEMHHGKYEIDYKIRNVLIDYFKSVDVLTHELDERVIFKN